MYLYCSTKEFHSDTQYHVMDMRYVFQDEASAGKFVVAILGYWSESEVTLETKIDEFHSLYPQVHVCATISMAKSKTDSPKKPATSMPSAKTCPAEKQNRAYRNGPGCRQHGTEGRRLMSLRTRPSKALSSIQRDPPRGSFRIRPSLRTSRRTADRWRLGRSRLDGRRQFPNEMRLFINICALSYPMCWRHF